MWTMNPMVVGGDASTRSTDFDAFDAIEKKNPRVILLDPAGRIFDQSYAEELAQKKN